jgi:ADP-dependent phosphofructokinase/glucokinase
LENESDTENEVVLVRTAEKQGKKLVWRDEMREIPPPDEIGFTINIPAEFIDELKAFPQNKNFILEIDLFYAPTPVAERGKRPYIPKMLMLADGRSGMIAGFQIIQPKEDRAENYLEIARNVFGSLEQLETRPQEIRVADEQLFYLLKNLTQQINVKLRQTDDLRAIEAAREAMFGFFGGGF